MTQRSAESWRTTEGVAMALGWGGKKAAYDSRRIGKKSKHGGAVVVHDAGGHDEEHLPVLKYKKQTIRRDSKL